MRRTVLGAGIWLCLAGGAVARGDDTLPLPCGTPNVPRSCGPCARPSDPCEWEGFDARRGPVEMRDAYLVAQPRLTLPAISPDTLGRSVTTVRGFFHWSSSFGFNQDDLGDGEVPIDRRFLVDGEARTFEVTATHGVCDDLDVGLRVPLHWRGGGILDEMIDEFHALTDFVTLDNDRPEFDRDRFRVHGRSVNGEPFSWDDEKGTGLGDVEAFAKWRFEDGGREGWSGALVGRVSAPTGTEPFHHGGFAAGAQAVAAKRLGDRFDLFLGFGATAETEAEIDGIEYEPFRAHVFVALEWRPIRSASLVLASDYATALVKTVENFDEEHWYLHLSAKVDLGCDTTLEIGTTENLIDQHTTADFGIHFGLVVRL